MQRHQREQQELHQFQRLVKSSYKNEYLGKPHVPAPVGPGAAYSEKGDNDEKDL